MEFLEPTATEQEQEKVQHIADNRLVELEDNFAKLQEELLKKTDVIDKLDKEVAQLRQDREKAVLRYATVEKTVLDHKNLREAIEKKNKDLLREIGLLEAKIKGAAAEKTRICQILDDKCHELKSSQKEVDKLKHEQTNSETKIRWHQVKLKSETEAREVLEKKVADLTTEINQLKLKEINRVKEDIEVERNMLAEKQLVEQNATVILLKHNNEEKLRKIELLEDKRQQMEAELQLLQSKHSKLQNDHDKLSQNQTALIQQLSTAQCLLDKQMLKIAELQSNQNDLEVIRTQLSIEKNANRQIKSELKLLVSQAEEHTLEKEEWLSKERELLTLNKELTESVVELKNECSLSSSKITAVALENGIIRKDKSYYESIIDDLRIQLDDEIKKRKADCQLMAKHISEKTKAVENCQLKIEELSGELEAQQKKHIQVIKELTREKNLLMKKSGSQVVEGGDEKSPTPSSTSESSMESQNCDYPTISLEPSQKQLIDRIVRLQNEIVRQSEKIDFLENHQAQLIEELKKLRKVTKK